LINLRLGSGPGDAREVMAAPFFTDLSWTDLERGRIPPPFKPQVVKVGREAGSFFCQRWLGRGWGGWGQCLACCECSAGRSYICTHSPVTTVGESRRGP